MDSRQALIQMQCANINLDNLARAVPMLLLHPFFKVVKIQLSEAIRLLEEEESEQ